uniref:Succinate:cytochrome c oxidoreductase subunit 3 n=1 Tax=Pyropia fucicola TaxID=144551 RepID=A0A060DCE9_9RHOD|nr:succinate:cytochrome c oxidoreductase subunit 3 [Neopyropia fucicola]AIB08131.1 succinate:cytochrome c oxidoreductase subunit 3 [Neopyropia fucicola]
MYNINRPISPHLTIYNPQRSSIFSIWHRISGVIMLVLIVSPIFLLNQVHFSYVTIFSIHSLVDYLFSPWLLTSVRWVVSTIFLYHVSNGIRHFFWDSVKHVNTRKMYKDSNYLLLFVLIVNIIQLYIQF